MPASDSVKYPVFLVEIGYDYIDSMSYDISHSLEPNDVGEYVGWDADGRPVEIGLRNGTDVVVTVAPGVADIGAVRQAILRGAELGGRDRDFVPSRDDLPLEELFREAEHFVKKDRLFQRIKRFFRRG